MQVPAAREEDTPEAGGGDKSEAPLPSTPCAPGPARAAPAKRDCTTTQVPAAPPGPGLETEALGTKETEPQARRSPTRLLGGCTAKSTGQKCTEL